jgi:hypothetical protein
MPDRQQDRIGTNRSSARQVQHPSTVGVPGDPADFVKLHGEFGGVTGIGSGFQQCFADIFAVPLAGQKIVGGHSAVSRAGPAKKIAGLIGPGAHSSGGHIQQMAGFARTVGEAFPDAAALFQKDDTHQ